MSTKNLSHVVDGQPSMVEVTHKQASLREALAETIITLPEEVIALRHNEELVSAKGPVIATAIIAGTMAAKQTSQLIPFCHQITISAIKFTITWSSLNELNIRCLVRAYAQTGVEMEALCGVNIASLTVYDMTKSLSHNIVLGPTKLIGKRGGKSDV